MGERKWSKKTDKIEVRLSPETKRAFHETCEQQGESASGVIRHLIEDYVKRFHEPVIARPMEAIRRTPWWARIGAITGLAAVIAGVALLPSSAQPVWEHKFTHIDEDGDGRFDAADFYRHFTPTEAARDLEDEDGIELILSDRFEAIDANSDGIVTRTEFGVFEVQESTDLFNGLDENADGVVQFAEFVSPVDQDVRPLISGMAAGTAYRQGATPDEFASEKDVRWMMGETDETPAATRARLGQLFRDFDANNDGRIVLTEFLAR